MINSKYKYFNKIIITFFNIIINSVYSKKCLICSELISDLKNGHICLKCKENISGKKLNVCQICSIELSNGMSICGQCRIKPPPFKKHVSCSIYKEEMRKMILLYKLSGKENLKYYISDLYKKIIDENFMSDFDVIIPVPTDPGRKSTCKPVYEISILLSKYYGKKLSSKNLIKIRSTEKQSSLNYNKRIKNLNNSFMINDPVALKGKRILLIDDVYTTGTTVKKCSLLLKNYSKSIYVATLARSSNIFLDQ